MKKATHPGQLSIVSLLICVICLLCNCKQSIKSSNSDFQKNETLHKAHIDTNLVKSTKGWELYSWYDKEWTFSLVRGTNRIKSDAEVINDNHISIGIQELKKALSKMPKNEIVSWSDGHLLKKVSLNSKHFIIPSDEIVSDIRNFCSSAGITLIGIKP
jgi:hypothetical protein